MKAATKFDLSPLCTPTQMAELLNVSANTIYYWVGRNEIPYIRVGRHLRFSPEAVLEHFSGFTRGYPACNRREVLVDKDDSRSLKTKMRKLAPCPKE